MRSQEWIDNDIYTANCFKKNCNNIVVIKRSIAIGYHVGTCSLCGTKRVDKDEKN